ncbi:MAG: hypothetical protein JXN63_05045 [Candidatus Delongbacteria bacterium]|nr:hypothetical protein [Candidatus Delongbacteria bacterium]
MKFFQLSVLILTVFTFSVNAETTMGGELFYFNQPGARSEAMGKGGVVTPDGVFSVFSNPSLIPRFEKFCVSASKSSPLGTLDDAEYSFIGAGGSLSGKLGLALTMNELSYGEDIGFFSADSSAGADFEPYITNYSLAFAFRPNRLLSMGFAGNIYELNRFDGTGEKKESVFSLDLGINTIVNMSKNSSLRQKSSIGVALKNVYSQKIGEDELPSILSAGIEYAAIPMIRNPFSSNIWLLIFTLNGEYQNSINDDHSRFSGGLEALISETVAVRCGYYRDDFGDYDFSEFTYGFGLSLPLYRLEEIELPFNVSLSYTSLPYPEITKDPAYDPDDLSSYSITVAWMSKRDY